MNNGIMTWFKSLNHGAILQAYASQQFMRSLGYSFWLIDYERIIPNELGIKKSIKKICLSVFRPNYVYLLKRIAEFDKEKRVILDEFVNKFLKVGNKYYSENYDYVMIGSDIVFDIKQGFNPYMYGIGINAKCLFSYAASSGGTTKELVKKKGVEKEILKAIQKFSSIGCRDIETEKYIKSLNPLLKCNQNIDPVLLYGFTEEIEKWDSGKWKEEAPYILIYSYALCMDKEEEINNIRKYAQKNHLRIVSCGYYHGWCDISVNCSPIEFIELFKYADSVITDTFHGTVFSLLLKKTFCSYLRGNGYKLEDLLKKCDLDERIAKQSNDFSSILSKEIDWNSVSLWLNEERKKSTVFIKEQLI